jgi:hypothetical protein
MAYLILSTDGKEWNRRELTGPIVLGRAPDCDIPVHDILLSRRHCRLTPSSDGWLLIDLASRNGTQVGEQTIEQHRLIHRDIIRLGRTELTFCTDVFVPPIKNSNRPEFPPAISREEALAGTVVGIAVPQIEPDSASRKIYRPSPKPRPMDPVSFHSDNLYTMLEQIASSSWDSIYAVNAQPLRRIRPWPQPRAAGEVKYRPSVPKVSLELQASSEDRNITTRKLTVRRRIARYASQNFWNSRKCVSVLKSLILSRNIKPSR